MSVISWVSVLLVTLTIAQPDKVLWPNSEALDQMITRTQELHQSDAVMGEELTAADDAYSAWKTRQGVICEVGVMSEHAFHPQHRFIFYPGSPYVEPGVMYVEPSIRLIWQADHRFSAFDNLVVGEQVRGYLNPENHQHLSDVCHLLNLASECMDAIS